MAGRFFICAKAPLIFATILIVCGLYTIDRNWGNSYVEPLPYHLDGNGTRECLCGDEMMCLLVHPVLGRRFDCQLLPYLKQFKLRDADAADTKMENIRPDQVTIVTYSSGNHFAESRQMIVRLRENLPNRIVYYDLGLRKSQISELTHSVCNLEIRRLNYSSLPSHIKDNGNYAWKDVIVAELLPELPYFFTMDTSIMLKNVSELNEFYEAVNRGEIEDVALRANTWQKHGKYTYPVMFEYLPMSAPIRSNEYQLGATIMFIRRSLFTKRVWKWVLLCALTKHCIAPPNSLAACFGSPDRCHRFDQSAVNIVLRGQMGFQPNKSELELFYKFMDIDREKSLSKFPTITCS